jgi:hypothetical protein
MVVRQQLEGAISLLHEVLVNFEELDLVARDLSRSTARLDAVNAKLVEAEGNLAKVEKKSRALAEEKR